MIKFSTFTFELSIILSGFGIYEMIFGRLKVGTSIINQTSFGSGRLVIITAILVAMILHFLCLTLITRSENARIIRNNIWYFLILYAVSLFFVLSSVAELQDVRQLYCFSVAMFLASISVVSSKIEERNQFRDDSE